MVSITFPTSDNSNQNPNVTFYSPKNNQNSSNPDVTNGEKSPKKIIQLKKRKTKKSNLRILWVHKSEGLKYQRLHQTLKLKKRQSQEIVNSFCSPVVDLKKAQEYVGSSEDSSPSDQGLDWSALVFHQEVKRTAVLQGARIVEVKHNL